MYLSLLSLLSYVPLVPLASPYFPCPSCLTSITALVVPRAVVLLTRCLASKDDIAEQGNIGVL